MTNTKRISIYTFLLVASLILIAVTFTGCDFSSPLVPEVLEPDNDSNDDGGAVSILEIQTESQTNNSIAVEINQDSYTLSTGGTQSSVNISVSIQPPVPVNENYTYRLCFHGEDIKNGDFPDSGNIPVTKPEGIKEGEYRLDILVMNEESAGSDSCRILVQSE